MAALILRSLMLVTLLLGACNETIDQEVAERCRLSADDWQKAQRVLDAGRDGMVIHAGRCKLTRKSKDEVEGVVAGD